MKLLLFKGRGFISRLIRWQTRSKYSHAALLLSDGRTIIEAWQGAGVRVKEITDWTDVDLFEIEGLTPLVETRAYSFACDQVGKKYDYWGVIRFVSRRHMPANEKWFCSELAFAALEIAGLRLLERIDASEVSPHLLSLSPLLLAGKIPPLA